MFHRQRVPARRAGRRPGPRRRSRSDRADAQLGGASLRRLRSRYGVFFAGSDGRARARYPGASGRAVDCAQAVRLLHLQPVAPRCSPDIFSASEAPLQRKLEFLPNLALFWFSADSPYGGVDWGFAVTVSDLMRFVLLALLFGALFRPRRTSPRPVVGAPAGARTRPTGRRSRAPWRASLGVSTGGCTVMGCGAPVIPVVGLAFAGLTSGTLALLAGVSRVATALVFAAVTLGVIYIGWRAGGPAPQTAREKPARPTKPASATARIAGAAAGRRSVASCGRRE